jgi:methylphosphotriester-DNA--protein-cysteine methyltransferase
MMDENPRPEAEDHDVRTVEIGALTLKIDPAHHRDVQKLIAEMTPQLEAWSQRLGELIPPDVQEVLKRQAQAIEQASAQMPADTLARLYAGLQILHDVRKAQSGDR